VTNPEIHILKNHLRRSIRQELRDADPDPSTVVESLHHWLLKHPDIATITTFSPLPGEVDLTPLAAAHPDRRWVYPRVLGEHLTFHAISHPQSQLVPGAFGILEPPAHMPTVGIGEIDAFFCPGLAFDRHGGRLGRGKGFYDRILASARPDALKIGVCFPCQIVDNTHSQSHDIHMDAVTGVNLH
jgi:5-formyltetrahydrofolate cyclo-ligase